MFTNSGRVQRELLSHPPHLIEPGGRILRQAFSMASAAGAGGRLAIDDVLSGHKKGDRTAIFPIYTQPALIFFRSPAESTCCFSEPERSL